MEKLSKQEIQIADYRGYFYVFEKSDGKDDYSCTYGYNLTNGENHIAGIGSNPEEVQHRILKTIKDNE